MKEGVWFTTFGTSSHAVSNCVLAAYLGKLWTPTHIVGVSLMPTSVEPHVTSKLDRVVEEFKSWLGRFESVLKRDIELVPLQCSEEDYEGYRNDLRRILCYYRGTPRAVDITPGRKFASAIMMQEGLREDVDAIFYLHLLDEKYQRQPLLRIPAMYQRLVDLREEVTV